MSDSAAFQEVDDAVRQDDLKAWWKRWGTWVVAAAVIVVVGVAGMVGYRQYDAAQRALAHEPAPAAGAENYAKHASRAGPGPIHGLRQSKAVGVVGEAHGTAQVGLQIVPERFTIEPRRVGVLD